MNHASATRPMPKTIAALLLCAGFFGATLHAAPAAPAKPFLNPVFSDHMVLQRDVTTPIWGWTEPGKEVTVTLADKTATGVADAQGKWLVKLGALPAGGPHTLTVTGPQTLEVKDVLVGDVWLCSGQSNMQMTVAGSKDAKEEIAAADHPRIRQFSVPWCGFGPGDPQVVKTEPQDIVVGKWEVCSPQTAGGFTAIGYFFARDLQQAVDVPIGLIRAAVGGSAITSWCSQPVLQADPDLKSTLQAVDTLKTLIKEDNVGEKYFAGVVKDWWRENDIGTRDGWFKPETDTSAWKKIILPEGEKKADVPRYNGVVWFRKDVDIPADWAGKALKLYVTGIYEPDTQYFNGTETGAFDQGWINRTTNIPAELVKAGRNVIAVRVLASGNNGYQGPSGASTLELIGSKPPATISLAGERFLEESTPRAKLASFPHRLDNDFQMSTVLYNGMIAPLTPFALKGMIWYQGETPCPGGSPVHRRVLTNMIADWRTRFASPEAWFLIVQLPVLGGTPTLTPDGVGCAEIRAVQWDVGHSVRNADTAVITDLGDPNNIHPTNKQDVGKRLALIAQARIYDQAVEYSGPVFKAATIEGETVRIAYDHVGGGLVVKGDKLEDFAVAGADRQWVWADAKIDGDTVVVSSPQVKEPKFLRYDFVDVPRYTLWNKADLPAAPFDVKLGP